MNVTILEACRSPEVDKGDTEGVVLSRMFKSQAYDFVLFSNDGVWPDRTDITRALIQKRLANSETDVVHLAMHGMRSGLALSWSSDGPSQLRTVVDLLSRAEIRAMAGWAGRLIVSGACQSAYIAEDFLAAGARGVVAPEADIPWAELGAFFGVFYDALAGAASVDMALDRAQAEFPVYSSFTHAT